MPLYVLVLATHMAEPPILTQAGELTIRENCWLPPSRSGPAASRTARSLRRSSARPRVVSTGGVRRPPLLASLYSVVYSTRAVLYRVH